MSRVFSQFKLWFSLWCHARLKFKLCNEHQLFLWMHWIKQNGLCMLYIMTGDKDGQFETLCNRGALSCPGAGYGQRWETHHNPHPQSVWIRQSWYTQTNPPRAPHILDRLASILTDMGWIPRKEAQNGLTHLEIISTDFLIGHQMKVKKRVLSTEYLVILDPV